MIARLLLATWMSLLGLAVAVSYAMHAAWWPLAPLLLLATVTTLLAAVLACEFALVPVLGAARPEHRPTAGALLAAWWQELWVSLRLIAWRMPGLGPGHPPRVALPANAVRGLVLVHGYGCNAGVWDAWRLKLRRLDKPCVAVDLEPPFASIADYVAIIDAAVAGMQQQTGMAPVLVAHSMGGLAARAWWAQDPSGRRIHRLITIGSPHQGTAMATFGWGANAQQMRPQSAWLAHLGARESVDRLRRTQCHHSDCDNMVFPSAAATLPGADNRLIKGVGHVAMVDHPDIFAAALQALQASD